MKKAILIMVFSLLALQVFAAEETLFSGELSHGGFGGPVVKVTQINGTNSILVGGRGGWILNHSFILGGGGYGLVSDIKVPGVYVDGVQANLMLGYGGLELEYIGKPNKLVHYSIYMLVGGGGISNTILDEEGEDYENHNHNNHNIEDDAIWVIEPALNVTLNMTSFFRISAGAGYRYVTSANLTGTSNSDLSSTSFNLTFRFGKF